MLRKKIAESLTARIFLITDFILLCAGMIIFGLIAWATPITYTSVINDDLARQADLLAGRLEGSPFEACGSLLDEFIRTSGADAMLTGPDGEIVDTGSGLAVQPPYELEPEAADDSGDSRAAGDAASGGVTADTGDISASSAVTYAQDQSAADSAVTVTMSEEGVIIREIRFADRSGSYSLCIIPRVKAENLAVHALIQMAPWLALALLVFSLLCALVYSRYITRPIVRLSGIAGKMAEMDFDWECEEQRRDEIGVLGHSLNQMAGRLDDALKELETANSALREKVERERELDRQRMAFFSAASHELKTPVTILKGQLSGMLEGVDIYRDRDKYLLRSLQVTGWMENLIQEMLTISRMEAGTSVICREPVELDGLLGRLADRDAELLKQRGQRLTLELMPGITVAGDVSLLEKAAGSLLSNASAYSPQGAEIRVWCGRWEGCPAFAIENTGVHISEEALLHLFEPFYREDASRSRRTGGSGLGLYLAQMIFGRHGAVCSVENTPEGVKASVRFDGGASA